MKDGAADRDNLFLRTETTVSGFPRCTRRIHRHSMMVLKPDALNYDEWFSREVDKGLNAANRVAFVEHDDVRKMIDSRYWA